MPPGQAGPSSPQPSDAPATAASASTPKARPKTRVIRTFQEVPVLKQIMAEEWYEEMECGIQMFTYPALVPCGHSFCGPCTTTWISTNKTCPHCRLAVSAETPYVPNFLVDHIIERKVRLIADSAQKTELLAELLSKQETWRALQAPRRPALNTAKSAPGPSSPPAGSAAERLARRASREIHLGAPLSARGLLHLDEAHRALALGGPAAELALRQRRADAAEARLARALDRMEADALTAAGSGGGGASGGGQGGGAAQGGVAPARAARSGQAAAPGSPNLARRPVMHASTSSPALASRQARGRGPGTREQPLVVLSEDEDDNASGPAGATGRQSAPRR